MNDRYAAADRIGRVLKRWPLSANDILEYLTIRSLRSARIAIGFYFFVLVITLPMWTFADVAPGQMAAGYASTVVVVVALFVVHHFLLRLRVSACTSGPQPWLRYLGVCRWVLVAMAVVFVALGAWLSIQQYAGGTGAGFASLNMVFWFTGLAALFGVSSCVDPLNWQKLTPPSLPAPTQPVESLPPVMRASLVVPDKLAAFHMGARLAVVLVTVFAVLIAGAGVVWWLLLKPPSGKGWSPAMATGLTLATVYDFGTPGVAVLASGTQTVEGVDLDARTVLWTRDGGVSFAGDATAVVVVSGSQLEVIDAATGVVKASADLPVGMSDITVLWVGAGRVLYRDSSRQLCDASLTDPGSCLWTAPDSPVYLFSSDRSANAYVFAGGQYVNTGDGVLQMTTGQPASFGADAGQSSPDSTGVYYAGPSPDRVFRVVPTSSALETSSYQPWDTSSNAAISPAVNMGWALADSSTPNYLGIAYQDDLLAQTTMAAGYSWQTGQQLWQSAIDRQYAYSTQFANGSWLATVDRTKTVMVVVALDPATGREIWHGRSNSQLGGVVGNLVYVTDGLRSLRAYDMTGNFKNVQTVGLPGLYGRVAVVGGKVIYVAYSSANLWVLGD